MSPKNEDTPLNASSALNLAAIHFASVKLRSLDELLEVVPKKVPRRRHEKYQPRTVIAFLSVFDLVFGCVIILKVKTPGVVDIEAEVAMQLLLD